MIQMYFKFTGENYGIIIKEGEYNTLGIILYHIDTIKNNRDIGKRRGYKLNISLIS